MAAGCVERLVVTIVRLQRRAARRYRPTLTAERLGSCSESTMSAAMLMRRVVVALALLAGAAEAFVAPRASSAPCALHAEDPTKVWYAEIANTVQNLLTNSPLNEGKKAVVKMLAGPYDEVAVRAKLDGLIAEEPVLMLSFVR